MTDCLPSRSLPLSAEQINLFLEHLVTPLRMALAAPSEVVLHDLRSIPSTLRKISGNVTGREIGDPPTDRLLQYLAEGGKDHRIGYKSSLPDGRQLRSSTLLFTDKEGVPAAALCFNTDISSWVSLRAMMDNFVLGASGGIVGEIEFPTNKAGAHTDVHAEDEAGEFFPRGVEELSDHLIQTAIRKTGMDVKDMKKPHKVAVVKELEEKGFFLVKDSIDQISQCLGVSRFTIYNYLNEIPSTKD